MLEVHLLRKMVGNIDVRFVSRSKGTLVYRSSSSVYNRTSPSFVSRRRPYFTPVRAEVTISFEKLTNIPS